MATKDLSLLALLCGAFLLPVLSPTRTPLLYISSLKRLTSALGVTATASAVCATIVLGIAAYEKVLNWWNGDGNAGDGDSSGNAPGPEETIDRMAEALCAGKDIAGVELQPMGTAREL